MEESYWLNVAPSSQSAIIIQRNRNKTCTIKSATYVLFKLIIKQYFIQGTRYQITIYTFGCVNGKNRKQMSRSDFDDTVNSQVRNRSNPECSLDNFTHREAFPTQYSTTFVRLGDDVVLVLGFGFLKHGLWLRPNNSTK